MAKGNTGRRRIASRQCRSTPYQLPSGNQSDYMHHKKCSKIFEKKDWENATCSVCMEYPHNAVLLLCSSHDKGCRGYMCGTSFRYSNCLEQYKKAYAKVALPHQNQSHQGSSEAESPFATWPAEKCEVTELSCPLCRGQVKGWTVVEPAREYLNAKKRSCMHDDCSFIGSYREIRKHVRAEHPCAMPREVDPTLEQKWRSLEREQERNDVISTIASSMPGAVVFGDYVIEGSHYGFDSEDEDDFDADMIDRGEDFGEGINSNLMNMFLFLQAFGSAGDTGSNRGTRRRERDLNDLFEGGDVGVGPNLPSGGLDYSDEDIGDSSDDHHRISLVGRVRRQGRVLLGRSRRSQRRREANAGRR